MIIEKKNKNKIKKYLFFSIFFYIFLGIYVLSFFEIIPVSMYGIFLILFMINQLVMAKLNFNQNKKCLLKEQIKTYDILIVGYRENEEYWKNCLNSIKEQSIAPNKIIISIDGDDEEDVYMYDTAKEIFPDSIILLNIHKGKRNAIYEGYDTIRNISNSEFVVIVDSDTYLEKDACKFLLTCINSDEKIGCATSNIKIFNNSSLLNKIIYARYSYAFNIERAYLSYLNIMNCCSGPLSIYRKELITKEFLDKFNNQSCCKNKIEPGDDRHQTLLILKEGYKSKMTSLSICYTESPNSFIRFLKQQLRWCRSFYREQYWQMKCIQNQPYYLSIIMIYEIFFPFFIIGWILYLLLINNTTFFLLLKSFIICCGIIVIRTIFLICYTKEIKNIFNIFYLFIYILFIIPIKIYSVFTLIINNWITSNRKFINEMCSYDILLMFIFIMTWISILCFGTFNIIYNHFFYKHHYIYEQNCI